MIETTKMTKQKFRNFVANALEQSSKDYFFSIATKFDETLFDTNIGQRQYWFYFCKTLIFEHKTHQFKIQGGFLAYYQEQDLQRNDISKTNWALNWIDLNEIDKARLYNNAKMNFIFFDGGPIDSRNKMLRGIIEDNFNINQSLQATDIYELSRGQIVLVTPFDTKLQLDFKLLNQIIKVNNRDESDIFIVKLDLPNSPGNSNFIVVSDGIDNTNFSLESFVNKSQLAPEVALQLYNEIIMPIYKRVVAKQKIKMELQLKQMAEEQKVQQLQERKSKIINWAQQNLGKSNTGQWESALLEKMLIPTPSAQTGAPPKKETRWKRFLKKSK